MPCRVAIRSAKAVTEEVPEALESSLGSLAALPEKNSERDFHKLTGKFKLSIPLPLSAFKVGNESFNYLKMSHWAKFLLERNLWHHLSGLETPNDEKCKLVWRDFWAKFKKLKPGHEVFQSPHVDLERCCGLLLHGDEGRSARKSAILILAAHSIVGYGIRTSSEQFKNSLLKLNYKRPTWVTRFLLGVLPKSSYTIEGDEDSEDGDANSNVYESLLQAVAEDLKSLFTEGITSPLDGKRYFFTVLNVMGDWPFIQKAGNLGRSFYNAAKHATTSSIPKGVCHRCMADKYHPWEDFESENPAWIASMNTESPFTKPPVLLCLPHVRDDPAELFGWDLFHTWHIGAGKTFLGTAIILLAMSDAFDGSVPDRLASLSERFQHWCEAMRLKPHLRKLTKENLSWPASTSYPCGVWSKGHTTRVLNKWFIAECQKIENEIIAGDDLLRIAYRCAVCIENFLKGIYKHELFIPRTAAQEIVDYGLSFLRSYGRGASLAFRQTKRFFFLQPNLHRLHHIAIDMRDQCQNCQWILNPLALSTQPEEDYIGRPARVSRRVSSRLVVKRTLQRSLVAAHAAYRNGGILV